MCPEIIILYRLVHTLKQMRQQLRLRHRRAVPVHQILHLDATTHMRRLIAILYESEANRYPVTHTSVAQERVQNSYYY